MNIFVSYSNNDIAHVNSFSKTFNELNGSDLLFIASDKNQTDDFKKMLPGKDWKKEITKKINDSQASVLFLSESFFLSEEVVLFQK